MILENFLKGFFIYAPAIFGWAIIIWMLFLIIQKKIFSINVKKKGGDIDERTRL